MDMLIGTPVILLFWVSLRPNKVLTCPCCKEVLLEFMCLDSVGQNRFLAVFFAPLQGSWQRTLNVCELCEGVSHFIEKLKSSEKKRHFLWYLPFPSFISFCQVLSFWFWLMKSSTFFATTVFPHSGLPLLGLICSHLNLSKSPGW